ncbi:MAG: universal stress protein [Thermodesulfobacteriota bacterium]
MDRSLLVALDGSVHSSRVVRYLGRLFTGQAEVRLHLVSLVSGVTAPAGSAWEELPPQLSPEGARRCQEAEHCLAAASEHLLQAGIPADRISRQVQVAQMGVAADLLHLTRQGRHDALVLGRGGKSRIEELLLGSVSASILRKAEEVPLWIIDGEVDSRSFLVPVDGNVHTLKAVDHLAHMVSDHPSARITLFRSSALLDQANPFGDKELTACAALWGEDWCRQHLTCPDALFHAPEQVLLEAGFPRERLRRLETRQGLYASRQIIRQALMEDAGTIVMGRRPEDLRKGFLGSVSERVLANAQDVAMWIVS